jgi:hypothetical protein
MEADTGTAPWALVLKDMTNDEVAQTVISVIGHARAGRIAAQYNFSIDRDDATINLAVDGDNGTATCTCGWSSGPCPWSDFLDDLVKAHSSGHEASGQTVVDRTHI